METYPPCCFGGRARGRLSGGLSFFGHQLIANVYVDGFNLYYGCLRGTPYRWLNLADLCGRLFPAYSINRIRYFTALVNERAGDPQQPQRQQTYIRALETIPNLSVHYGYFLTSVVPMRLEHPLPDGSTTVRVFKTEEKGTDVNIASHLLMDAFNQECDTAIVISNDSDLAQAIRFVKTPLGIPVGIVNPHRNRSWTLANIADFYRPIRKGPLSVSLFPGRMQDANGAFTKPPGW